MRVIEGIRGSGKTTQLLKLADETGAVVVEPTARAANHARLLAHDMGLKNVSVTYLTDFVRMLLIHPWIHPETRYFIDELDDCLKIMGVDGYSNTVTSTVIGGR